MPAKRDRAIGRTASGLAAAVLAAALLGLCACGSSPGVRLALPASPAALGKSAARDSHLAVIVMENEELGDVIGRSDAPYINGLARRYASATDYHGVSHPSLPNYLAITGGDTFGISSDCTSCSVGAAGLADQFTGAHVSWRAYMEDMPRPCFLGDSAGGYAKKHDPFVYYRGVAANRRSCNEVVPLARLAEDLRAATLPSFVWITPNLCDDMHDCSVATGDRFLARLVPYVLARLGPHGLLAIVWDEGSSGSGCCRLASGGRVPLILAGPDVRRGAYPKPADHYSLLRLIEDSFALPRLRNAGCACTPSLDPMLTRLPRLRAR